MPRAMAPSPDIGSGKSKDNSTVKRAAVKKNGRPRLAKAASRQPADEPSAGESFYSCYRGAAVYRNFPKDSDSNPANNTSEAPQRSATS